MDYMAGKQSIRFKKPVCLLAASSVAGKKEGEGPLGEKMDLLVEDPMYGQANWEAGESQFLREAGEIAIRKAGLSMEDIRLAFSGDLLGQMISSSFAMRSLQIPFYGVYGACASSGAAISAAAMAVHAGYADHALAACSSHFASAEKEFRFPLGYGNQRPKSATWTVTGAGAYVLGTVISDKNRRKNEAGKGRVPGAGNGEKTKSETEKSYILIKGCTTGVIKDYGMSDVYNMGACMAPAAADTIYQALQDFQMEPEDFDCIATGDLGEVGKDLLISLLADNHMDISGVHMDCGMEIYDSDKQDTHAGGSGCACSALVLSALILPKLWRGEWKRVLFVPTGALLSQVTANEGETIPGIAHAVWLERSQQ
ncbi:MAG: stage V sporulation protein AD [Eubacterium sp.]|nr:stage V sporulation protein AD [Eubacterium sp.]